MQEIFPTLVSCKPLKSEYSNLHEIKLNSTCFTVGRGLDNMLRIPFLAISRDHCKLKKNDNDWFLEDNSSFGITVNKKQVGRGNCTKLNHQDIIALDAGNEFVYKFLHSGDDDFVPPNKRIKLSTDLNNVDFINDVKNKFEESQNNEIKHLEDKIHNTNQIKNTNILLKDKMENYMVNEINKLNTKFTMEINNLKGEKDEVERQKTLLLKKRDEQLATFKCEMETRIDELKDQIKKHNEMESELIVENELLKKKLIEERQEFLSEFSRENSIKQDMIDNLHAKMKEKEELRLKEKKEFEETLKKKTLELKLEKERELLELQEQKKILEQELANEVTKVETNLKEQINLAEKQKLEVQEKLNYQIEAMKKLENEDKAKMEELRREREEIEKKLQESQKNADKNIEELKKRVTEREIQLAALAAERIQKQAEQSSEVISSLQEQLEKVRNELKSVGNGKQKRHSSASESIGECSSKLNPSTMGDIMESELQCSVCSELFVSATTLNCSHSFCKYCITMWKKKKKDCPICRAPITSECKSIVLDSFIEKMVQNLPEEIKQKRQDVLRSRKELESVLLTQEKSKTIRRRETEEYEENTDSEFLEEEEDDNEYDIYDYGDDVSWGLSDEYDSHSGSDYDSEGLSSTAIGESSVRGGGRGRVPGRPGSFYGGYGRCFRCGARGHWAPGCPFA